MSEITPMAFSGSWPPKTQTDTVLELPNLTEVTQRFSPRIALLIALVGVGGFSAWYFDVLG